MKKWKKNQDDQIPVIGMDEQIDQEPEETIDKQPKPKPKKAKKKSFITRVDLWVKKTFFLSKEERVEKQKENQKEIEQDKEAIEVPIRQIVIIMGAAIGAAIIIVFVFDLTGWRTGARNAVVDAFVEQETTVIEKQLQVEYDYQLEQAKATVLQEEKAALEKEQQAFKEEKDAFEQKRADYLEAVKKLENDQKQLEQDKQAFEELKKMVLTEEELITQKSDMIAEMDPQSAADILTLVEDQQMVIKIIENLKKDEAAAILEVMNNQKAADIIDGMKQ